MKFIGGGLCNGWRGGYEIDRGAYEIDGGGGYKIDGGGPRN